MLTKVAIKLSHFRTCTCGVPAKEGIPCRHLVVLVKSSIIPGLTQTGIMSYFLTIPHWQMQYPLDVDSKTDISMANVKKVADKYEEMRYCPDWSAGEKYGCPKKNDKVMAVMDHIKVSSMTKRKHTVKLYCTICKRWNHSTVQCCKNPLNCKLDKTFETLNETFQDEDGDDKGKA